MITGDSPLTACHIAKELNITTKAQIILDCVGGDELLWHKVDGKVYSKFTTEPALLDKILKHYDPCATGTALELVSKYEEYSKTLLHRIWVYARTSPSQKEFIVTALK